AVLAAQQTSSDDLFTWSGRLAPGATLGIRHFNGPIDVREASGDRVEFRAERRARRSNEVSFEVQNESDGVTLCSVWRGRSASDVRMKTISSASDMQFVSGNGSISVALPSSFNGEIDATTGNGEFRSDFDIRVLGRLNPHHVRGTIGTGGGQVIRMSSGSGRL